MSDLQWSGFNGWIWNQALRFSWRRVLVGVCLPCFAADNAGQQLRPFTQESLELCPERVRHGAVEEKVEPGVECEQEV